MHYEMIRQFVLLHVRTMPLIFDFVTDRVIVCTMEKHRAS
jgi:hypothetical protein